jgi:hypothetical protein
MKKLLTIMLCLILTMSASTMFGCQKSIFDGNYTETSKTEVATLASNIADADGGEEMDYAKGAKLYLGAEIANGEESLSLKIDIKTIAKDNDLKMEGSVDFSNPSQTVAGKLYYSEGFLYLNSDTEKSKQQIDINSFFDQYFSSIFEIPFAINDFLEDLSLNPNVKCFVDDKTDVKKIKIEFESSTEGTGKAVFVYNAQYKLIALSYDISLEMNLGDTNTKISADFTFEPWSGSISTPTDLDTYDSDIDT